MLVLAFKLWNCSLYLFTLLRIFLFVAWTVCVIFKSCSYFKCLKLIHKVHGFNCIQKIGPNVTFHSLLKLFLMYFGIVDYLLQFMYPIFWQAHNAFATTYNCRFRKHLIIVSKTEDILVLFKINMYFYIISFCFLHHHDIQVLKMRTVIESIIGNYQENITAIGVAWFDFHWYI